MRLWRHRYLLRRDTGLVDTAVIGNLGNPALIGAIAIGAMIFSFIYWGFGFLRMGTTGLIAQCRGAEDNDGAKPHSIER